MEKRANSFGIWCQLASILLAGGETLIAMQGVWFSAFFHGLNGGLWTTTIDINSHGGAYFEFVLWCVMTPVILYGSYLNLKLIYKVYEENN